jgi:glycosyltransferase involved in cell wall biosynthesis
MVGKSYIKIMKILHITPHLGGGVGKAIYSLANFYSKKFAYSHAVALLEEPEKPYYAELCGHNGIQVELPNRSDLAVLIAESDIVVINWWHHPAMAEFLANFPDVQTRTILWCHVNGCVYPYMSYEFANRMDYVCFTTPYSLENPYWTQTQTNWVCENSTVVYGIGEDPNILDHKTDYRVGDRFTIGYVGTLNYAKLRPDFVQYCQAALKIVPNLRFVMVGDRDPHLSMDAERAGISDSIEFLGYVSDPARLLMSFDVFGYLLNSDHFGTTENALLEAMAVGLPAVVMNQSAERHIVRHGDTGYLVSSPAEYADTIRRFAYTQNERQRIGENARARLFEFYSAENSAERFKRVAESVLKRPKLRNYFRDILGGSPIAWFSSALNPDDKDLFLRCSQISGQDDARELMKGCRPIFRQTSKSSVHHFSRYFPEDAQLAHLSTLLGRG